MFSSLSRPAFRRFFIAQSFSVVGTFGQEVALAWLVFELTHSATALGLAFALQYVPLLLLAPYAGVKADQLNRRKLFTLTQGMYAVLCIALWLLVGTGQIQTWMVFAFALATGTTGAFNTPTRVAFLHDLVDESGLHNAVSLNATLYSMGRVVGPAVAGLIIAAWGTGPVFLLNALTYAGVIAVLVTLKPNELHVQERASRAPGQFRAGLSYARHHPTIGGVVLMTFIVGVLTYEFPVTLPALAKLSFGGDASTIALFMSLYGLGAMIGGLVNAKFKPNSPHSLIGLALLLGGASLLTALQPILLTTAIAIVGIGFCAVRFSSFANSVVQLLAAPTYRGRVVALWTSAYVGSNAIGGPLVGYVAETAGPRWALALGAAGTVVAALICARLLTNPAHTQEDSATAPTPQPS